MCSRHLRAAAWARGPHAHLPHRALRLRPKKETPLIFKLVPNPKEEPLISKFVPELKMMPLVLMYVLLSEYVPESTFLIVRYVPSSKTAPGIFKYVSSPKLTPKALARHKKILKYAPVSKMRLIFKFVPIFKNMHHRARALMPC